MSSSKVVIICLILLMAIFIIAMSFNLKEKPNEGVPNHSTEEQKIQAASSLISDNAWLKAVNKLLSPFATSLTPQEVSMNCSKTNRGFFLSEQTPTCEIGILGFSDKAFKKLSLKPNNSGITLQLHYIVDDKKDDFPWPARNGNADNIELVVLAKKEQQGKTVATIKLTCTNCDSQKKSGDHF